MMRIAAILGTGLLACAATAAGAGTDEAPEWLAPWLGAYEGGGCLRKYLGREHIEAGDRAIGGAWFKRVLEWSDGPDAARADAAFAGACGQAGQRFRKTQAEEDIPQEVPGLGILSLRYENGQVWVGAALRDPSGRAQQTAREPLVLRLSEIEAVPGGIAGRKDGPLASVSFRIARGADGMEGQVSLWEKGAPVRPGAAPGPQTAVLVHHAFRPRGVGFYLGSLERTEPAE